jgi:hypothetical protein
VSTVPTTSTTTLPCAGLTSVARAGCLLAQLPPATCAGDALPKPVTSGLDAARKLLGKAESASPKAARRLARMASARVKTVGTLVAQKAKKGKVAAPCASAFATALDELRTALGASSR